MVASSAGCQRVVTMAERPPPQGLGRREDREAHLFLGQDREHVVIDRGLGQPHALGAPAEPVREVSEAPADLRHDVATGRQRQDHVAVPLRDRPATLAGVARDDRVDVGVMVLEP